MTAPRDSAAALAGARGADTATHSDAQDSTALYAVVDWRQDDEPQRDASPDQDRRRRLRILGEYREVGEALAAAKLLRWAGSPAQVVLITSIRDA